MMTAPDQQIPALLRHELALALKLVNQARDDGDPGHQSHTCSGACRICHAERVLNRLISKIPRQETSENLASPASATASRG